MTFNFAFKGAVAACLLALCQARAAVTVTIDAARPGPVINKNVYGQFAEHLGAGIYGGLWVGPQSPIPNTRGWRKDVVGALRDLQVPLVRWPGGCFADEYHWRDGIGAREHRLVKINTNWGGVAETNAVGTHEFFDLADQLGAQTYVNGNLGTGSVQEMAEWLEYMTGNAGSALAALRARNGHPAPFKVDFFAIGNEAWGCGGDMTAQTYAAQYRQYQSFLKAPSGARPKMIASGGTVDDSSWSDVLSRELKGRTTGISFHYYTMQNGTWEKMVEATGFGEDKWISTLVQTLRMDGFVRNNIAQLDKNDPEEKIGLLVDEWGTWYDVEPGTNPGFLYQQNTLRDAVVAALNFNIFHRYAERVTMTNIAQMVNVLQAMILTDKDRMILTPIYHAFHMYRPFQDATSLPIAVEGDVPYRLGEMQVPGLSASAARAKDGKLVLALVNTHPGRPLEVAVNVNGQSVAGVSGRVLTAAAMDAHNTFAQPRAIEPAPYQAKASGGKLTLLLPPKSVVVVAAEQ
ncbi:MAG: alpha-N-arabinofuranosidase [Gammaproteobacteria bacterium]